MAGGIKGITVKIGGDTTELGRALSSASKSSSELQKELKGVNTLLKMDPGNVTLLKQKQDLLTKSIGETQTKLNALKETLRKADSGEIELTEEEYRNLQREIASTEQALKRLTDEQARFGSVGAQQIAAVGEKMKDLGGKIEDAGKKFLPVTGLVVGLGTAAVNTAANFDASMSNVAAISGATGDDFIALRNKAREMGASTKFSASEAADAMSYMAMAGWKTGDMLDGISGVMLLAAASGEDLAKTSDILTDGLTAFGLSAAESGRMANVMAAASSNANTNVSLLGESYKYAASTAGAMGYSVEDVTESLGLMANAGVKGSQAGTTLKNAMINLAKPTKQMATAMTKYGISITNSDGSMKSWNEVVGNLRESLGGLSEAEQTAAVATLFGKEATAGMLAVINAAPKDIEKLNKALNNCDYVAENMAKTMQDNLKGQLQILKSQLEELAISFGDLLMPIIRKVVSWIQAFVDRLNNMSESQKRTIAIIAAVVASVGPLLIVIGKLTSAVGTVLTWAPKVVSGFNAIKGALAALFSPIGVIIAVVGALVAAFVHLWNTNEEFRDAITEIWNNLVLSFQGAFETMGIILESIGIDFSSVADLLSTIWNGFCELLAPVFTAAFQTVSDVLNGALSVIIGILDFFVGLFSGNWDQLWTGVYEIVSGIWAQITGYIDGAINAVVGIIDTVLGWFGTDWETVWTSISTTVSTIWEGIKTAVSTAVNDVGSAISSAWDAVSTATTEAWNAVTGFLSGIWDGIKTTVSTAVSDASTAISGAWEGIKSATTEAWNAVTSTVSGAWEGLKTSVSTAVTNVKTSVSNAWNTVTTASSIAWNNVKTGASTAWNNVKSTVSTVATGVQTSVTNAWNNIKSATTAAWDSVKKGVSDAINSAKTTVMNVAGSLITSVKSAWDSIASSTSTIFENIKTAMSTAFETAKSNVINTCTNIWNGITGIFGNAKTALTDIGKNLIEGLWNGISDMGTWISEKIQGFGSGVLNSIKSFFGIASPSKVMRDQVGKFLAEGVAVGVTENADKPIDAMEAVGDGMTDAIKGINGATINRKLATTFSVEGAGNTGNASAAMLDKLDGIYERLSRLQIVLDTGTLIGETIDKIDAGLAGTQLLRARGV